MHRVVRSHLNTFKQEFSLSLVEDKAFEAFSAYCIAKSFTFENVDPDSLIYEGSDPGIDSVFFIVNEQVVTTVSEIDAVFAKKKTDNEIRVVFVQSKTSDAWQKQFVDTFAAATLDFVSDESRHVHAEALLERRAVFNKIIDNLGKVRSGRPDVSCYVVTTGGELQSTEIISALKAFDDRLSDVGLFRQIEVSSIDRDRLITMWTNSRGSYEAQIEILGSASFPRSDGIEESYVVTLSAKRFVDKVLSDERGNLRRSIFDENVRDFIDLEESSINSEIQSSLIDDKSSSRFGILNNGVTIISPDVRIQSNEVFISNFQIVNGCQTSNVLYESRDNIPSSATLMVKIIETSDQSIVDEIVKSTNRQNKIEDHQFIATMSSVKNIEKYFQVRGEDEERRLFFERRPHQYGRESIPAIRIFDLKEIARCCGAMFFDRPDLSSRYPNQLVEDLKHIVFSPHNKEEIFYTAAFAHYRLRLLSSNQRVDPLFNQMRWYALMAVKYFVCGDSLPNVTSHKVESICEQINEFVIQSDTSSIQKWERIAKAIKSLGHVDRDRLRASKFVQEVREAVITERKAK